MSRGRLQVALQPDVLRWARERTGISREELAKKMHVKSTIVLEWERSGRISIARADRLAQCTHTPLGFLYLAEPPEDRLPIPDFRTRRRGTPKRLSPDLLETVETMQRRQAWMRDELIEDGAEPLDFVGAFRSDIHPREVAAAMRDALQLDYRWASQESTWTEALGFQNLQPSPHAIEDFCHRTAAEFLVPEEDLRDCWRTVMQAPQPYEVMARKFKVSSIVAARRTLDLDLISNDQFFRFYQEYTDKERHTKQDQTGGGNFWNSQKWRIGPRFGTAVIRAVKEGRLLYREAYSLTGLKGEVFEKMSEKVGTSS